MLSDTLRFYSKYLVVFVKLTIVDMCQQVESFGHGLSYRRTSSMKKVVVIGGSFSGFYLARRLAHSLPTGYKVVLIEKNSHFNYIFNFPRYSVLAGHEHKAFVPYDGIARSAPSGIFERVQGYATQIKAKEVVLQSGETVGFDFLAIATGTARSPPINLATTEKKDGCIELRSFQDDIKSANNIGVVGGGAVGVQIASDIKSIHPQKRVVLIHSRDRLLPNFGEALHTYVLKELARMGVEVVLNERPSLPADSGLITTSKVVKFKDGRADSFDLIVSTFIHPLGSRNKCFRTNYRRSHVQADAPPQLSCPQSHPRSFRRRQAGSSSSPPYKSSTMRSLIYLPWAT